MCRSRRELSNAYLLAKIGVDTAENEPLEVWGENSIQYSLHSLGPSAQPSEPARRAGTARGQKAPWPPEEPEPRRGANPSPWLTEKPRAVRPAAWEVADAPAAVAAPAVAAVDDWEALLGDSDEEMAPGEARQASMLLDLI